jgi:hypothetical protein
MAHHGAASVGHAVSLAQRAHPMSPLIFPDPAIMLAIALAKDWL